jgi:phytoene synthase
MSHHAKSFRWAAAFLSDSQQRDVAVAYSFCRAVDDAVDEAENPTQAVTALGLQQDMLTGQLPADAITRAYQELAQRCEFGLEPATGLLKGARSDLGRVLFEDDTELLTYCFRVAGTVGIMMCGILGVVDPDAKRHAIDLGIAMQLTNICRDVLEDAVRGRVYLPKKRLQAAGVRQEDLIQFAELLAPKRTIDDDRTRALRQKVAIVVRDLLRLADERYESARLGYPALPVRPRLSIMVAAELYQSIGHRLRDEQKADPLRGRVIVSRLRKVLVTLGASLRWLVGSTLNKSTRKPSRTLHQICS